jgi:hypothetical protein
VVYLEPGPPMTASNMCKLPEDKHFKDEERVGGNTEHGYRATMRLEFMLTRAVTICSGCGVAFPYRISQQLCCKGGPHFVMVHFAHRLVDARVQHVGGVLGRSGETKRE